MKTSHYVLIYKIQFWIAVGIIGMGISTNVFGQVIKTWETTSTYKNNPQINIQLYETHAEIFPVKEDKIVLQVEYIAEGDNPELLAKLENAMKKDILTHNGNEFTINNRFFSTMQNWSLFGFKQGFIVLKDGEKIDLEDFTFQIKNIKIYLPSEMELKIEGRYGKMDMHFSMNGNMNMLAYDFDFIGKSVTGKLKVDAKYSKIRFDKLDEAKLILYETRFGATETGNTDIDSKYSQFETGNSGVLKYLGYEDKMSVNRLPSIKMDTKYCHVRLGEVSQVIANMYEGSLNLKKTQILDLNTKYLELEAIQINTLKMNDGYENRIMIESVDSLISVNGKYNNLQIQNLNKYFKMDGYDETVKINQVNETFSSLFFDGKYLDLNLNISKNADYRFKGAVNYPEFHLLREEYNLLYHDSENNYLKYEYLHGKNENPTRFIQINGYEVKLTMNHL